MRKQLPALAGWRVSIGHTLINNRLAIIAIDLRLLHTKNFATRATPSDGVLHTHTNTHLFCCLVCVCLSSCLLCIGLDIKTFVAQRGREKYNAYAALYLSRSGNAVPMPHSPKCNASLHTKMHSQKRIRRNNNNNKLSIFF